MKRRAVLVASSVWLAAAAMRSFAQAPKSPRPAGKFKFEPIVVRVRRVEELGLAFNDVIKAKVDALYLASQVFTFSNGAYLAERALEAKLPLIAGQIEPASALLSYSTDRLENFRRAAALVDKILRGAKPGDLPVEQPERYQMIVNMKTAKAIGVTLSQAILARADRVIE